MCDRPAHDDEVIGAALRQLISGFESETRGDNLDYLATELFRIWDRFDPREFDGWGELSSHNRAVYKETVRELVVREEFPSR